MTFGLAEDRHHARFPADRYTEARPVLNVFLLQREGALVPGSKAILKWGTVGFSLAAETVGIRIDSQYVAVTSHAHLPLRMFVCPGCGRGCYRVYEYAGRWRCRTCPPRLDYGLSRHLRRGAQSGVGRIEKLRRRLGCTDVRPFSPLAAPRPHGRSRAFHLKLAEMILDEEAKLVGHLGSVVRDLQHRP